MNQPERLTAFLLCEQKDLALLHSGGHHVPHTFKRTDKGMSWSRFVFSCDHCGAERTYGGGSA